MRNDTNKGEKSANIFAKVSWRLAIPLAILGLLWPFSKAMGWSDHLAPAVIGGVWVGIRALWVVIVIALRDKRPFWTVMGASVLYEAIAIIPQQIYWSGAGSARFNAMISTIMVGVVVGALFGGIAQAIARLRKPRTA